MSTHHVRVCYDDAIGEGPGIWLHCECDWEQYIGTWPTVTDLVNAENAHYAEVARRPARTTPPLEDMDTLP